MSRKLQYMPQLDGLRSFAVMAVVFSHYVPKKYHLSIPWGSMGVQLFFVLSGFLITTILLKSKGEQVLSSLRNFYVRRTLRIFPLYYFVLLLCVIFGLKSVTQDIYWHLAYLSNLKFFLANSWPGTGSHLWSLSVEEQFYLFWPLFILWVPKNYLKTVVVGLFTVGVVLQLLKPLIFDGYKLAGVLTLLNFDSLGAGGVLALFHRNEGFLQFKNSNIFGLGVPLCGFILITALANFFDLPSLLFAIRRLLMVVMFTWIIYNASVGVRAPAMSYVLSSPFAVGLGKISYGVYVWHSFVPSARAYVFEVFGITSNLMTTGVLAVIFHTILTILIAALSWRFFEAPINKLKERWT